MRTDVDLRSLHGRVVLVKSAQDRRNPPVGMRGTLEVREDPDGAPTVSVELEFPQMFTEPAHHRSLVLSEAELARLLASEREGTFALTIEDELG